MVISMSEKTKYTPPDFRNYEQCPNCVFQKGPKGAKHCQMVLSTTNHPTYIKINNVWKMPENQEWTVMLFGYLQKQG